MMSYSNQYHDSISTVQLSPFAEDEWNRIITYSPVYVPLTDLTMTSQKQALKPVSGRRSLVNGIDMDAIKLDDEILLNEIQDIRRIAAMPARIRKNSYHEASILDEEHDRRPTSPTDEYQRSSDFFYQTRESFKPYCSFVEPSFSNPQYSTKRSLLQPQTNNTSPLKALSDINFGPKPHASLSVQLRQSTIARERALATSIDPRSTSPITLSSSRGAIGRIRSGRRTYQQNRISHSQTPQTIASNVLGGLYERLKTDTPSSVKKIYPRNTNTSRTTIHMLKTKNDRARQKQNIELKTILVNPSRQPISSDSDLDEVIPNSIEIMRKLGGPITAFESNLRYNYHRHLNQFRNDSTKC